MESIEITVRADRLAETVESLKTLAKKAKRYGIPFEHKLGPERIEDRWIQVRTMDGWVDRKVKVAVHDLEISKVKIEVGPYKFLASIEFAQGGNFVDTVPGEAIPTEYQTTDDRCEHCNASRRRNHVFIVQNTETGEFTQVGRTCLRDFMGITPAQALGKFDFAKLYREFSESQGFACQWHETLEFLLVATLASIRLRGWVSKGQARYDDTLVATAYHIDLAWAKKDRLTRSEQEAQAELLEEMEKKPEEDREAAAKIIEWVRESENTSDYMHNLRVAFSSDVLSDPRRVGLAISAVAAWHRAQELEIKRAKDWKALKESAHVGEIKERLKEVKATVTEIRGIGDRGYGYTELLKFLSDDGNLFTWFTTSEPEIEVGDSVTLDGTVKKHGEFKGIKETMLTRVRLH